LKVIKNIRTARKRKRRDASDHYVEINEMVVIDLSYFPFACASCAVPSVYKHGLWVMRVDERKKTS